MDLIVVDEVTRTPIGRPVLTLAIDVHTRVVTGFYLGLDHPSILRAGVCVAQSVFEKGLPYEMRLLALARSPR